MVFVHPRVRHKKNSAKTTNLDLTWLDLTWLVDPPDHDRIGGHFFTHGVRPSICPYVTQTKTRCNANIEAKKAKQRALCMKIMTTYWLGPGGSLWSLTTFKWLLYLSKQKYQRIHSRAEAKTKKSHDLLLLCNGNFDESVTGKKAKKVMEAIAKPKDGQRKQLVRKVINTR